MTPVSRRGQVEPFHVMEVLKAGAERQRTHGDVIFMCAGQPSTPAPQLAREMASAAMQSEVLGYTESTGILALREAIAAYHHRTSGISVDPDEVIATTGSSGGFGALFLAAFDAGDTVVMARPGYPAYRNTLTALGVRVLEIDCGADTRYQLTLEMVQALPEVPRGIIVASPANPTSTVIDSSELARIAEWCEEVGCLLISDEIYHGVTYGRETASAWQTSRAAVVVGSVSKYFSMTGWRLGWLLLPEPLRRPVELLTGNLSICPPAISQHAAIGALDSRADAELTAHVRRYAENRDVLLRRLPEIGVSTFAPPDGAFYAWCDVSHLTDNSLVWCQEVLARTGVAITPGIDFDTRNGSKFVRVSYCGTTAEVDRAMDRLAAAYGQR